VKVVADSSPLIALARIRQFDLLRRLFGTVIVPAEVYAEVVVAGAGLAGAAQTANASWIEVRRLQDRSPLAAAHGRFALDLGELSVLLPCQGDRGGSSSRGRHRGTETRAH